MNSQYSTTRSDMTTAVSLTTIASQTLTRKIFLSLSLSVCLCVYYMCACRQQQPSTITCVCLPSLCLHNNSPQSISPGRSWLQSMAAPGSLIIAQQVWVTEVPQLGPGVKPGRRTAKSPRSVSFTVGGLSDMLGAKPLVHV